jgi:hypothetical protein
MDRRLMVRQPQVRPGTRPRPDETSGSALDWRPGTKPA